VTLNPKRRGLVRNPAKRRYAGVYRPRATKRTGGASNLVGLEQTEHSRQSGPVRFVRRTRVRFTAAKLSLVKNHHLGAFRSGAAGPPSRARSSTSPYEVRCSGASARRRHVRHGCAHRAGARRLQDGRFAAVAGASWGHHPGASGRRGPGLAGWSAPGFASSVFRVAGVDIPGLDFAMAQACGELCAARSTPDVVDASVVLVAREHRDAIVTSDVEDLRRLDPSAHLERI
jgi:hypothetical protein